MKKEFKNYSKKSNEMTCRWMDGDKSITLRDIDRQCYKERLEYLLDYCSFNRRYLIPVIFIPVVLYSFFLD